MIYLLEIKKSVIIQNKILKDLSTYFEISDYIDDGKTVVITPKIIEFKNYLDDNNISEQEIFFTFTENIKKTEKNYEITFKKTDLTNISITYINNLESENPEIKSIEVRRRVNSNNSLDLNFNINDYQYSSDITSDDDKLFYQNHVGNKIYLNISASDFDTGNSGIRRFIVYETLEKDSANNKYFSQYGYKDEIVDYYYYKTIYEGDDIKKEGNNTILQKEIELKTNLDGALKITIAVIDNSNNFITKSFYVILETGKYINFNLFNNVPTEENFYISARNIEDYGKTNFIIDYNKNIRKIFMDFNEINFYSFNSNKNWHEDSDKISVKYSYIDDDNEIITAVLEKLKDDQIKYNEMSKYVEDDDGLIDNWNDEDNASSAQNKYYFEIQNVKDLSNFSFDIILKEDDIYEQKYSFTFPEKVDVYGKSGTELLFDSKNNEIGYIIVNDDYILATSNINKEFPVEIAEYYTHEFDYEDGNYVTLKFTINNPDYYPVGIFRENKIINEEQREYEEKYYLFGQIDIENPITTVTSFENHIINSNPELKIFDLYTNGTNSKKLKLEVELKENYWELENPSSIYLLVEENGDKFFFENNKTKATFIIDNSYFLFETYNFITCISKGNTIKQGDTHQTPELNTGINTGGNEALSTRYDCFPPFDINYSKVIQYYIGRENFSIKAQDNPYYTVSGISKIELYLDNKILEGKYFYRDSQNYYMYSIPLYDFEDGNYSINVVAYDNSIEKNNSNYSNEFNLLYLPDFRFVKHIKRFDYDAETINDFVSKHPDLNETTTKLKGYILYWNNTDKKWDIYKNIQNKWDIIPKEKLDNTQYVKTFYIRTTDSNYYDCSFQAQDYTEKDCFIKTMVTYDTGNAKNIIFASPQYYYITNSSSFNVDVKIKNFLSNKDGMLISSDQPVFVQTLVTSKSYDEAKTWSYERWNKGHPSVSEEVISFSTSNSQQIYNIDFDQIPLGYSYVTVVHFADDTIKMGDVYTKERN